MPESPMKAKTFAVGKYASLKELVGDLDAEDVLELTGAHIASEKVLIFESFQRMLAREVRSSAEQGSPSPAIYGAERPVVPTKHWDLSSVVVDVLFLDIYENRFLSLKAVVEDLKQNESAAKEVEQIMLSSCGLQDIGCEHLDLLVQLCPNVLRLDISNNNLLEGDHSNLFRWLQTLSVDITGNPLASTDGADFFLALCLLDSLKMKGKQKQDWLEAADGSELLLSRLIWIPENWVPAGQWKALIPSIPKIMSMVQRSRTRQYLLSVGITLSGAAGLLFTIGGTEFHVESSSYHKNFMCAVTTRVHERHFK